MFHDGSLDIADLTTLTFDVSVVAYLMSEMFWSTNIFILVNRIGFFIINIPYVHM